MDIKKYFVFILSMLIVNITYGQTKTIGDNYLSLGTKTNGVCFGNSSNYNGIRLNLWDNESKIINGLNFSFAIENKIANGIQIGGLVASSDIFNGLSISSIWLSANKINGAAISFGIDCDTLNGLFVGFGIAAHDPAIPNKVLNGFGMGVIAIGAEKVRGATICGFWSYSNEHYGLSIACFNKTENLHGLQIGLLNYAGNNPKLLRWLPVINFHP